jgi:glyoxylase-like metal-dependent hydrolase (beta-lactamase superfamily II)/ribosomal protein S18 acetylase RimI-like enzyme
MKISESCYAITGLACEPPWTVNAGFIAGTERTLIIDTGSTTLAAQTIYGYALAVRPPNGLMVLNTEKHLDHINGNAFFREKEIDVYGHAGIARRQEDLLASIEDYNACIPNFYRREQAEGRVFYANTRIANPNKPISEETRLDLGGLEVQIIFTPGHTPTNISVFLPEEGVLYCGDCIVSDYVPNLEGGSLDQWFIWLASLNKIEALAPKIIMPGHGEVLMGARIKAEIERVRQVLQTALHENVAPTLAAAWQEEQVRLLPKIKELTPSEVEIKPGVTLSIIPAGPQDARLVQAITRQAYAEYSGTLPGEAGALADDLSKVQKDLEEGGAILAWLGSEAVGTARFSLRPDHLYVQRVAVLPGQRGQGIASALMRYMEEVARRLERSRLRLGTRVSLPRNIALYQKLGYEITYTMPHPRTNGADSIAWMESQLK